MKAIIRHQLAKIFTRMADLDGTPVTFATA